MVRCAICLLLATALAFPAQALTFDLWNSLDQGNYDRGVLDRTEPVAYPDPTDSRLYSAASTHSNDKAAGYEPAANVFFVWLGNSNQRPIVPIDRFTDVGAGIAKDHPNAVFNTFWELILATGDNAPQMGNPQTSIGMAMASIVGPIRVPLPPSLWLFATALVFGLLFARRRVDDTASRRDNRPG